MGPVEVAAGAVLFLVAVVCAGVWVAAARRRRNRRRREEVERGADDSALRAEVVHRLERAAAEWDGAATAHPTVADADGSTDADADTDTRPLNGFTEPAANGPAPRPGIAPTPDQPARHGRPGRRIRVRWDPRA